MTKIHYVQHYTGPRYIMSMIYLAHDLSYTLVSVSGGGKSKEKDVVLTILRPVDVTTSEATYKTPPPANEGVGEFKIIKILHSYTHSLYTLHFHTTTTLTIHTLLSTTTLATHTILYLHRTHYTHDTHYTHT